MAASFDNRETCTNLVPSSCIPYTGTVSDNIKDKMPQCRPNINDLLKALQDKLDNLLHLFGETKDLDCIGSTTGEYIQSDINKYVLDQLCQIKSAIEGASTIDPDDINIAIDILCLNDDNCFPKTEYNIKELFNRLIKSYCDLNDRVKIIEQLLNI